MTEFDILTLADVCVDLVLADADPEFGQKEKLISSYLIEVGGSCTIFASQAAKLELRTAVAGVVGDDLLGDFMLKRLTESGVNIQTVEVRKGLRTAASFALCRGDDRSILTDAEGITAMSPKRVTRELLGKNRHLHVGSYFLLTNLRDYYPEILTMARDLGLTISLDTNWDPDETWKGVNQLLQLTDVFLPNENEILAITGSTNLNQALGKLAEIVPLIVVKRGSKGAIARKGDQIWEVPPFNVSYVDGVGAGDSFDAGFLKGFLNGWSIEDSLRLANYCGAMNTTAIGGLNGQPRWSEIPATIAKLSK